MKEKIEIGNEISFMNTLNLFGGNLDLMYGTKVDEKLAEQLVYDLKFCALFYKHIIVSDALFHCYGPLYDILRFERDNKPFWKATLAGLIEKFLLNGIIVPAIREGNSLYYNWKNSVAGIIPGGSTCLTLEKNDDTERYLNCITEKYSTYCKFPEAMKFFGKNQFYKAVEKYIFNENNEHSYINIFARKYKNYSFSDIISESRDIVTQFADSCKAKQKGFRRGVVEVIISEMVGISPYSKDKYTEISRLAFSENQPKSLRYHICNELLSISNTIYQVLYSLEFKTIGGIFHGHHDWLIDAGLFDTQIDLGDLQREFNFQNIDNFLKNEIKLRIGMLSINDIIKIRQDEISESGDNLFDRYCNLKIDLANGYDEKALERFIEYLSLEYLPKINTIAASSKTHSLEQKLFGPLSITKGKTGVLIQLGAKAICFFVDKVKDIGLFILNVKDYVSTLKESQKNRKKLEFYLESKGRFSKIMTSNKNQYTV